MTDPTLSDHPAPENPPLRFFDSFLQESNIKWLLAVGTLILLGSSLMLVASHWGAYTPLWKYTIMLGYTGVIYLAGQWSYQRLGLRKTGTGLLALTVLLLPALFLGLAWVQGHTSEVNQVLHWAILTLTLVFTLLTSSAIFRRFLREPQPTFQAAYIILCLALAIAPALPAALAPWAALALWAVFGAGTVKVNRHVFWLAEQQQFPRIFGFFPIALLGGIFLAVFALNFSRHLALEWLGLACVLTAIPVLLTADTIARVFAQRSGGLIGERPTAVIVPLLAGLILCGGGIALAGAGLFAGNSGLAITPTAALVAALLVPVAQRTGKSAFVWAMLICATLAYNFSPFFFQTLALQLLASGAAAVNEQSLPYAFYGLTYLPLIAAAMVASVLTRRRANLLFSMPLQWFSIAVSAVLLAVSLSHAKAMFPVALLMVLVFAIQTVLYRLRWLALPALMASIMAAFAFAPFAAGVLAFDPWWNEQPYWLALLALLLLMPGDRIDGWLAKLPAPRRWLQYPYPLCQCSGLLIVLAILPQQWLLPQAAFEHLLTALALGALLALYSLRLQWPRLALLTLLFAYAGGADVLDVYHVDIELAVTVAGLALLGQWLLTYLRLPAVLQVFGHANRSVAGYGLPAVFILLCLPLAILDIWQIADLSEVPSWLVCQTLITLVMFDIARRRRNPYLTRLACIGLIAITAVLWLDFMGIGYRQWLPVLWALIAAVALYAVTRWQYRLAASAPDSTTTGLYPVLGVPVYRFSTLLLTLAALASLAIYTLPAWIAGGIATLALYVNARRQPQLRRLCLALLNWQLLALAIVGTAPVALLTLTDLLSTQALAVAPLLALICALSRVAWQYFGQSSESAPVIRISRLQRWILGYVTALALILCWYLPQPGLTDMLCAMAALLVLAITQLVAACREQREYRVWLAFALIVLAVAVLAARGFITFGHGWSPFIVLALGVASLAASRLAGQHARLTVLVRPLYLTGLMLPMVAVVIGIYRYFGSVDASWLGRNSLAMLLAAAFYFWHGYEQQRRWAVLLATAIVNLALALLWRDLAWSDPQLYMIPIGVSILLLRHVLRGQMPVRFHEPLNYLGALVILVSPMFHIATGSWLHIFTLMLVSVAVILVAIGLRIRALMYTGAAFLLADMIAMIVRGSIDNPNLLWLAGLLLGAAVFALGAFAERNREQVLQRLRLLTATLADWD